MLLLGKIFLHKNGEKCGLSDRIFLHTGFFFMKNGEKSGENGEKSGMRGEKSGENGEKFCMDTQNLLI